MAKSTTISQIYSTLTLIPGLPNDLSAIILSYVPICYQSRAKQTCKSWRHFYTFSKTLIFELRQSISRSSTLLCIFPDDPSLSSPYLFDPTHLAWTPLPRTPVNPHAYSLSNFSAISVGTHLYVLGGSLFDTRSFPLDRPTASSTVFRFDFVEWGSWETVRSMITPRGSFAVAVERDGKGIVVAGGGSRHPMFGAAGSREGRVERYDVGRDEWVPLPELPGFRAGCVGFTMRRGNDNEEEFWVMGGYGGSTTIAGVLPVDEQCRDLVVMGLGDGEGEWREVGDMWGDGQRGRLGKVVVIDHEEEGGGGLPKVFMLDENADICRFNMALNSWVKETTVPRKNPDGSSFGFVAIQGELHVISLLIGVELSEIHRSRHRKRGTVLSMQIYNPKSKSWRSLVTRTPFQSPLDFKTAVMCTIRL